MAGSTLVIAYQQTGEEKYRRAADKVRAAFDDYPRNRDGGFWHGRRLPHEMWIDGVFMGLMFLTRYGAVIGDRDFCYSETIRQIVTLADHCRKGRAGYSCTPTPNPKARPGRIRLPDCRRKCGARDWAGTR